MNNIIDSVSTCHACCELKVYNTVDNFLGGKLKLFFKQWQNLTSDKFILQTVNGYKIELDDKPIQNFIPKPIEFNGSEHDKITTEVEKFLSKNIIRECQIGEKEEYFSNIFIRPKKDGSVRVILNLKNFNEHVEKIHFKMDSLNTALWNIKPNDYFASIDLKDSYYSVPVHENDKKYLKFIWNNNVYQFCALPQGLSTSPRVFTKILKPVYSTLRKCGHINVPYIDDSLLIGRTYQDCENNVKDTISLVDSLGFTVHPVKSVFIPTQEITFLGFVINSVNMTVKLTHDRIVDLQNLCRDTLAAQEITIREFAKLIGKMVASEPGVQCAPLFYKDLEIYKEKMLKISHGNYDSKIHLTTDVKSNISWWIHSLPHSYKPIVRNEPDIILYSDSSKTGWGGINETFGTKTEGFWSEKERELHINVLELKAALLTILSLLKEVSNKHIRLNVDNTVTVAYIENFGGRIVELHRLAKEIWKWCLSRGNWLSVAHVAGVKNVEADKLSRKVNDDMEWSLKSDIFEEITNIVGNMNIDLFASRLNHKLPRYVSYNPDPQALAINAFTIKWINYNCYIFPPFSVIGRVIQKIIQEKVETVVLIAPIWPTQVWFPQMLRQISQQSYILPKNSLYLPQDSTRIHPIQNLRLGVFILSGNDSRIKDYQRSLQTSSYNHGDNQQGNNMGLISNNGCVFQINTKLIRLIHLQV